MSDNGYDLDGYVDVPDRIERFYEKFPDGRLTREGDPEFKEIGDRLFIIYRALAYRSPDDEKPGKGIAWEPFPGPTPFTKDSELMNAETSAWGRAIVAVGIVAKGEKVASRSEVAARGGGSGSGRSVPKGPAPGDQRISEGKARRAFALKKEHNFTNEEWNALLAAYAIPSVETLHWKNYEEFCEYLERKKPLPDADHPTDVPADTEGMTTEFDAVTDVPFS